MMSLSGNSILSTTGIIEIPPESSTRRGSLCLALTNISRKDFAHAGLIGGPGGKLGSLNCELTIRDTSGVSASHNFVLNEE